MADPIHVTEDSFDQDVLKAAQPVVVDFWADWCAPCRMVAPVLEELAREQEGKLTVAKLDVDEHPGIAQRFHVAGIPTLILFKDGREVDRIVGYMPKQQLWTKLSHNL